MSQIRLNDTDEDILEILAEGRNVPSNIADELGFTRQYVQRRLSRFEENGYIRNVGRGLYELVDDPREV